MFMSGALRSDLGLKAYQQNTSQLPHPVSEGAEGDKIKIAIFNIMQAMARGEFLFIDENIFTIEEVFNQQIDRIYATSRETHDKDPERPSSCFSHGFVGECHMMPPPSSISVKRG